MSMKILFVRHGKDDDRYRGGWSPLDLLPEGREQAQKLARYLQENQSLYRISRIVSGDLRRTMTTANIVASVLDLPVIPDTRLREINNGDLAGMPNEKALTRYPGLFFSTLEPDEPYPNGESPREFYDRIHGWFDELLAGFRGQEGNLLVVTHGGVINVLYHIVNGIEWNHKERGYKTANCGLHVLDVDSMCFETKNQTDFL